MATATISSRGLSPATAWARRTDLITGVLALWMTLGSYVDGWAHTHLIDSLESFFTPWHGLLYSGWLASAAWIYVNRDRPGYRLGLIGAVGFGMGGAFDLIWHTLFGIEATAVALISPPHLWLLASHLLIISTPLRAAWMSDLPRKLEWRRFAPIALSVLGIVMALSFMLMYETPFNDWLPSDRFERGGFAPASLERVAQKSGLAVFFVSTMLYVGPLLALLKRWRPPFGTATLAIGVPAVGLMLIDPLLLGAPTLALSGIGMGFLADLLIAAFDPSPERPRALLAFGAISPIPLAGLSLLAIAVEWGLGWGINLVTGSLVLTALTGLGLALMIVAPERPLRSGIDATT
jgi:hypothetical protein